MILNERFKKEADRYIQIFKNSAIHCTQTFDIPFDSVCECIEFTLGGRKFQTIDFEQPFAFSPPFLLVVLCPSQEELLTKWDKLIASGSKSIVPLGKTDFAACIVKSSATQQNDKTKEALELYKSVFQDFSIAFTDYADVEQSNIVFSCFNISGDDYFAWDDIPYEQSIR